MSRWKKENKELAKRILGKNSGGGKRRKTAFQRLDPKQEWAAEPGVQTRSFTHKGDTSFWAEDCPIRSHQEKGLDPSGAEQPFFQGCI